MQIGATEGLEGKGVGQRNNQKSRGGVREGWGEKDERIKKKAGRSKKCQSVESQNE